MSILTKKVTRALVTSPLNESATGDVQQGGSKALVSPWAVMAVTCVLLGISGGIRFWRDLNFSTVAKESSTCPFPLKDLPRSLGTWQAIEGSDSTLDPEIARLAGSSDHVIRTYQDSKSGEQVLALVLYGLAPSVFGHVPEVCYPASGFQQSAPSVNQTFTVPGSTKPVEYRVATFTKSTGSFGGFEEAEVYYTFLYDGGWRPELASQWKSFRYHPAMFKIQLQRLSPKLGLEASPTESLLRGFVEEINSRVAQTKTQEATLATPRK